MYDHRSYLANDVDDCISQIAWDFFVLDQYVPPKESSFCQTQGLTKSTSNVTTKIPIQQ